MHLGNLNFDEYTNGKDERGIFLHEQIVLGVTSRLQLFDPDLDKKSRSVPYK